MFFKQKGEQEGRTGPAWEVGTSVKEEDVRKGYRG
jgi:hypothetical protein